MEHGQIEHILQVHTVIVNDISLCNAGISTSLWQHIPLAAYHKHCALYHYSDQCCLIFTVCFHVTLYSLYNEHNYHICMHVHVRIGAEDGLLGDEWRYSEALHQIGQHYLYLI